MSSGKKKYPKKRTYTEGEYRRALKQAGDDTVARVLLLCIVAARDMFNLDDNGTVNFMETMQRYVGYEADGLIDLTEYSKSLKKNTGIDLKLSRW